MFVGIVLIPGASRGRFQLFCIEVGLMFFSNQFDLPRIQLIKIQRAAELLIADEIERVLGERLIERARII